MSTSTSTLYNIAIKTSGKTKKVFQRVGDKAYYKLEQLVYPSGVTDRPVTQVDSTSIVFNELNTYTVTLTVYPIGCPMAQLPINLEVVNPSPNLTIVSTPNGNSLTVSGEITVGTIFKFYTDAHLLKYFNCIQLLGTIAVSTTASQLAVILARDDANNVAYISNRPELLTLLPVIPMPAPGADPLLPDQYPASNSVWPWTEAIIPWETNQTFPSGGDVIITPPAPVPPVPPYVDGYQNQYDKFRSVPDGVIFCLGYDAINVSPTAEAWTVFLRNFVDRGYSQSSPGQPEWQIANYEKRQYMNAFSIDKLQFYLPKIMTFVNTSYSQVVINRLPFTSSFELNVLLFFLSIHIGTYDYPDYVLKYFQSFINFVGIGNSDLPASQELMVYCNATASSVFDYFQEKATIAINNQDTSTIAYWWNLAGLSTASLLFESVHNIVAFSQFTNVLYSIIYASINPTNPLSPFLPPYPNFFTEYTSAPNSNEQLNVVREAYRLTVPNSNSFSRLNPDTLDNVLTFHIHQQIMIENNPGLNVDEQLFSYFTYNPSQYNDNFGTNLDGLVGLPVSNDFIALLPTSPLDQETVVHASRPVIPIFPKPTYAPFGLGYRRCAGEVFVYLVTEKLLAQFSQATYEIQSGVFPTVYIAPFKGVPDNIFAVQNL